MKIRPSKNPKQIFKELLSSDSNLLSIIDNFDTYDELMEEYNDDDFNVKSLQLIKDYFIYVKDKIKIINYSHSNIEIGNYKYLIGREGWEDDDNMIILHNFEL